MRKIASLCLFALMFSIFSSQLFAGNADECEILKDGNYTKGLYGLCIAYYNAGNDNARDRILANYNKKAGPGDPPLPINSQVTCPCWDLDTLTQMIACSGLPLDFVVVDPDSSDAAGFDLAVFQNSNISIQTWAGYTPIFPDDANECFVNVPAGDGKVQYKDTDADEDAACRLDVLDLIAVPPVPEECDE